MAKADHSIDTRILESARAEFMNFGFEKASLKSICEQAGITTGALYKRYAGKEDLFCAVVEPTRRDLEQVYQERAMTDLLPAQSDDDLVRSWDMAPETMMWWFRFLQDRRDGFLLLISRAAGTRYENFQHDWVEKMTEATYLWWKEAFDRGLCTVEVTKQEMHCLLTSFWSSVYEPFIHGFTYEEIKVHSELCCRLFSWYKAFGFREEAIEHARAQRKLPQQKA